MFKHKKRIMEKTEFYFNDEVSKSAPELEKMANCLLVHMLDYMKMTKPIALSVTLVDDETIHQINKDYRKIDRPTDVISFAYDDDKSDAGAPVDDLGEIVISLDTAIRQAAFYAHPVEREIAFLMIHGFLHLNGYDHMKSKEDETIMFALQNEILDSFVYQYKEVER
jgi:probable rRNA maturation factor